MVDVDYGINNTDQVVIPTNGSLEFAPFGTPVPTKISDPLNAAFTSVGWIGEDAPKLRLGRELVDIMAWQRRGPIMRRLKKWDVGVKLDLLELAYNTWRLALGGVTVTEVDDGEFNIVPSKIPEELVAVLTMTDGTYNWRFIFLKGTVGSQGEFGLPRDNAVKLPIDFALLELEDSEDPFIIQSDDPSWLAANSEGGS